MTALLLAGLMVSSIAVADESGIQTSIRSSLRYLQEEGDRWLKGEVWVQDGTGCVSCHHDRRSTRWPARATSTSPSKKKDYIYRYWGTAWAAIGLSRAVELD